jgi:hypothetical protein
VTGRGLSTQPDGTLTPLIRIFGVSSDRTAITLEKLYLEGNLVSMIQMLL